MVRRRVCFPIRNKNFPDLRARPAARPMHAPDFSVSVECNSLLSYVTSAGVILKAAAIDALARFGQRQ
jgi:hypothetical protein